MNYREKKKTRKFYTLMLIPNNSSSRVINIRLKSWVVNLVGLFIGIFLIVLAGSFYYSSHIYSRLLNYYKISAENRAQKELIGNFKEEKEQLKQAIQDLREKDFELRTLLGLRYPFPDNKTAQIIKKNKENPVYRSRVKNIFPEGDVSLDDLGRVLRESQSSYVELQSSIKTYKEIFDYTPSIWPIYGFVIAGYGWRRHPIFGTPEFHRGIDIPSFEGANVKATASGVVVYADWASGYGITVMINHKYEFITVYGHNSRLLVKKGDFVRKGQIIAECGSTGLSTGPHVHYEVRRWNKSINPVKYLDLDIYTAKKEVW